MEHKTFELTRCLIDRGRSQVRVDVPEHEIRVLRAVHGTAEVKVIETDVDEIALDPSAEAEWDRLTRTYKRVGAADPVRFVFPGGPADLERFGFRSDLRPMSNPDDVRAFDERKDARKKAKLAKKAA